MVNNHRSIVSSSLLRVREEIVHNLDAHAQQHDKLTNSEMMIALWCVYQVFCHVYLVPSSLIRFRENIEYNLHGHSLQRCELMNPTMMISTRCVY